MNKSDSLPLAVLVNDLSFSYTPSDPILRDISFSLPLGGCHIFIGPNGGGKSTLLRLIMGLLQPTKGSIGLTAQRIGWVPQKQQIDRYFPIRTQDYVLLGSLQTLRWDGSFPETIIERGHHWLEAFGLASLKERKLGDLSGGQLQRATLAMAFASDPELLILDEPTSCLDPQGKEIFLEQLKKLNKNTSILMVTHDFDAIPPSTDRCFLVNGSIRALSLEELCTHTQLGLFHFK